ncbi:MAG: RNA polymerase sigma-70 factor [Saprospiraceae bacterium]|nr:RNA polymerase sigma-70 factor [Lewinella sp.]
MDLKERIHLQRLTEGNKASFVYFHSLYLSRVYHYCFKFVRSREVAEEISSDVFVKLWEKRAQLRSDTGLEGLLFKIARDFCLSYLRQVARNADLRKHFVETYLAQTSNTIEEEIYLREGIKLAGQAIDQLPPKCRQVFRLRYLDGLSLNQIAEELHISTNTVQNHLQKGTRLVKVYLQEHSDLAFCLLISSFFAG